MLLASLGVVGGLGLLVVGAEVLVRGASGIALLARLTPMVVGLTVVSAGTSMPEFVVTVDAAWRGSSGLAMGNVVGSNILNIGLILGLAALIRPLRIQGNTVRMEWPVMMIAAMQLYLLARDGIVDRVEGLVLVSALVAFTAYLVWIARRNSTARESAEYAEALPPPVGGRGMRAWVLASVLVAVGVAGLALGAELLVDGATTLAREFGIPETTIGLTVVAAGTSAPELATSVVAAVRGRDDIAVANVVGSNIINVLGILGLVAVIVPVPVPPEILARDSLWMLGLSALLFPLMLTGMRLVRAEGAVLLALLATYFVHLFGGFG